MTDTLVVHNPKSGSGNDTDDVRARCELQGYALRRTEAAGDAVSIARAAIDDGFSTIVAAGGDGTVNEVVQGIDGAGAFDDVTLGVLPLGTGNNFAGQIGVTDVDTGFSVLESGDRRRIDLGRADGHPFVNSCIAGLTAESSGDTSAELKNRLGVLAYVLTTLRTMSEFDPLRLRIDVDARGTESTAWSGNALFVLIGNGRRFTMEGSSQANMEDGLLDVAIIEDVSAIDLMSETVLERLLGRDSAHVRRFRTPSLTVRTDDPEAIRFSLDGEIVRRRDLSVEVARRTLTVAVGDGYDPMPDEDE